MFNFFFVFLFFSFFREIPPKCPVIKVCVVCCFSNSKFPSGFNLTSRLPILKGTSLLFLQAAAVTSFFYDHSLSVLLCSTGLNDCNTMLHCPRTCDVGTQESHLLVQCKHGSFFCFSTQSLCPCLLCF